MKLVIFAGGSGTRLWPLSRRRTPKQGQPFLDHQTLLQKTYARLRQGWPAKDIWLSTSADQFAALKRQLPQLPKNNVILEPVRRDTAGAIGLAASVISAYEPDAIIGTVWADAFIKEPKKYIAAMRTAERVVKRDPDKTTLIGLKPRYADSGLGYIKMKQEFDSVGKSKVFLIDRFIEKPGQATAERFVSSWQYLWNPGMFVFQAAAMLDKFRRWMPSSWPALNAIHQAAGTSKQQQAIKRYFPKMKKIALEYAIIEKDRQMLVIPADFFWTDVGNWSTVHEILAPHPTANVLRGRHVIHDGSGNILYSYSGKLIAAAGIHNMVVIENGDAILVCPRDRAQDVKKLVAMIEEQALHEYL